MDRHIAHRSHLRPTAVWFLALGLAACGRSSSPPGPKLPLANAGSVRVTLDADAVPATRTTLEPLTGLVDLDGNMWGMAVRADVRRDPIQRERLILDFYLFERAGRRYGEVYLELTSSSGAEEVFDLERDPFAGPTSTRRFRLGGLGPEGVGRRTLGFTVPAGARLALDLTVFVAPGSGPPRASAPLALAAGDSELWVVVPDTDRVAVIDTDLRTRSAEIAVPGRPKSLAITPNQQHVLVASSDGNEVTVIDRGARRVVARLGEADGLGRDLRHILVAPDGRHVYVSAYVSDEIDVLALGPEGSLAFEGRVPVGRRPLGLALSGDGSTLFVSHFLPRGRVTENEGWVSVIDTKTRTVIREAVLEDEGNVKASECLTSAFGLDKEAAIELSSEGVPTQLGGVFLDPNGAAAWIPGTRVGPFPIFEGNIQALGFRNLTRLFSPAFLFVLDTRTATAARPALETGVLDFPDADRERISCFPPMVSIEHISRAVDPMNPRRQTNPGAALPVGSTGLSETGPGRFIAFSRGGRRLFFLSQLSDEISVFDAVTHHPTSERHFTLSGDNPTGMVVSEDGRLGYVAYENSLFVSVLDLSAYAGSKGLPEPSYIPFELVPHPGAGGSLATRLEIQRHLDAVPPRPPIVELAQVATAQADPLPPALRRGRILFSSANPERFPNLSVSRGTGCASCHPDGGHDGAAWGTMEGERRTTSLYGGVGGRGFLHASGTHANAAEFVRLVVPERLGGALSEEDYDALAAYVDHGVPRLQAPRVDPDLVARGEALFATRCASCHVEEARPSPSALASPPRLWDIGSATPSAHVILGPMLTRFFPAPARRVFDAVRGDRELGGADEVQSVLGFRPRPTRKRGEFKAPSLANVYDYGLFFHDGRVTTLQDAVRDMAEHIDLTLADEELVALVEYLKTL